MNRAEKVNSMHVSRRTRRLVGDGIAMLLLLCLVLFFIFPIFYAFITSLKTRVLAESPIPYLIFRPTLENYRTLFVDDKYTRYFLNSLVIGLATVALSLLAWVPAAYVLSRRSFRGKGAVLLWVLSSRILPPIGIAIPFFLAYRRLGLIDTHLGLVIIFLTFNISLTIWVMSGFFDQIPRELDEAAIIDGCSMTGVLVRVVLPLTAPGLTTTAILVFLEAWNNFFFPLVVTRRNAATVPLALTTFLGDYNIDWGAIMAGASLLILPLLIFAVVIRRYLVAGLTQGAVKG
jgi:multiple sugar transport system permease protein